jgi:hypothetical protein
MDHMAAVQGWKGPDMRTAAKLVSALFLLVATGGCGSDAGPPSEIPKSAYSGTGDLMAQCMQYASESYCEREIWGGNDK